MTKISVKGTEIAILDIENEDYISITDMLKAKDGDFFISDWLRNRNTVEFLGIWEHLNNPNFNYGEYAAIRSKEGLHNYKISVKEWVGITAKEWRENNKEKKGNIRDYANVSQLVCLSNLENLNALFINENLPQDRRLIKLNKIAIHQMKLLTENKNIKRLGTKK
ncbi:KilA-N domain-containing protein [Candidatus Woesearchaeota archaeon]|nr:KilA-N domain-containing protein [Candidatus Woesearchaeota archaeon]